MRDELFKQVFVMLTPRLHRFIFNAMRSYPGDRAAMSDDLLQQTAMQALMNSRLPQYDNYTVERLIYEKMYNIIFEYRHPAKKRRRSLLFDEMTTSDDGLSPYHMLVNRLLLDRIYEMIDHETWSICHMIYEGYSQKEIAEALELSADAIAMRMYRLRKRLGGSN